MSTGETIWADDFFSIYSITIQVPVIVTLLSFATHAFGIAFRTSTCRGCFVWLSNGSMGGSFVRTAQPAAACLEDGTQLPPRLFLHFLSTLFFHSIFCLQSLSHCSQPPPPRLHQQCLSFHFLIFLLLPLPHFVIVPVGDTCFGLDNVVWMGVRPGDLALDVVLCLHTSLHPASWA